MATHLAAVAVAKGQPFEIQARQTPRPGPGELLIAVKSVALNPADHLMRDLGLLIPSYPTVVGFDIAGLVLEVGDNVPTRDSTHTTSAVFFQPGVTRVAAYAAFFWRAGNPDYGAFQQRCLVPWQHAVPILDDTLSWNSVATLPVSVQVPLMVWDALNVPRVGAMASEEGQKRNKEEALLIWGASSSVGTMGVQSGRLLREDRNSAFAAVYATAGPANLEYVTSLGADRVFDYHDPHVAEAIVSAARKDELAIRHCFLAMGNLEACQAVLRAFVGAADDNDGTATRGNRSKIASAPPVSADAEMMDGIEVMFLQPSAVEEERLEQFRYCLGTWLKTHLADGTVRPSPEPVVVGKGLDTINAGLNMLRKGVSCAKLVVEVEQ